MQPILKLLIFYKGPYFLSFDRLIPTCNTSSFYFVHTRKTRFNLITYKNMLSPLNSTLHQTTFTGQGHVLIVLAQQENKEAPAVLLTPTNLIFTSRKKIGEINFSAHTKYFLCIFSGSVTSCYFLEVAGEILVFLHSILGVG